MEQFISEDDLQTFEGWLNYQGIDLVSTRKEELETWRSFYDDVRLRSSATPKVGLMKLRLTPGEYRYAVAVREGSDLWLTLWVRRSPKGEFFVLLPRGDRRWNVHTSYHLDGTFHTKSYGRESNSVKWQPLTGVFRGTQSLGMFSGHGPKGVGAICDPIAYAGVVEVSPGVLGPRAGCVAVDLVEPGCEPMAQPWARISGRTVFRDFVPWVVITIGSCGQ